MKIIITGGTGFIGTNLCLFLLRKENIELITLVDNFKTSDNKNLDKIIKHDSKKIVKFINYSVSDDKLINKLLNVSKEFDIFFHLAAQSSGENSFYEPMYDIDTNILGTKNSLLIAKRLKIKHYIFTSTMSVYGNVKSKKSITEKFKLFPKSIYGLSKLISEDYINLFCKSKKLKYTILRLFNVYGPYQDLNNLKQGMLSIYLHYLLNKKKLIIKGSLNRTRDFIFIEDLCEAFWLIMKKKPSNEIYNLGTGKSVSVKKLINNMFKRLDLDIKKYTTSYLPSTPGDVIGFKADISKIKKFINWHPKTDIKNGLNKTITFYKK